MTRVEPLRPDEVEDDVREAMELQIEQLGMVAESLLTMARRPRMAAAFSRLAREAMVGGTLEPRFKQLVAYVASTTSGCRYCQAHTSTRSSELGMDDEKVRRAHEFEASDLFSEAERDALRLARDAALVPNAVTDEHFERLRRHYSDDEIVELVGVVSVFGYLNRWNDTMATTLERKPREFASRELERAGWEPGAHA